MKRLAVIFLALLLASCSVIYRRAPQPVLDAPVSMESPVFSDIDPQFRPVAQYFAREGHLLPEAGNSMEIYTFGRPKFDALMADLSRAQSTIDMEYYRFSADSIATEVRDLLIRKAAEGVVVRVILEPNANDSKPRFYKKLKEAPGVHVVEIEPTRNWLGNFFVRDHRKLVVIDGKTGYVGGMNVQDRYHTIWRDTHTRITGPVVRCCQALFDSAWAMFGGPQTPPAAPVTQVATGNAVLQLVGDGPDSREQVLRKGLEMALSRAQHYFYIQNPYFCPAESTLQALFDAVARGVDVQLMFPDTQDVILMLWTNHSFYERLLRGGVRLFERSGTFMHSKTFVTDDYLACIGSTNIDQRSYGINYEDNLYIYDRETALRCKAIYDHDMESCREITLADVNYSLWEVFMQKVMMFIAPQL